MSRRSLWPREHGAYFQLAVPLITALAMRVPSFAAVALAVASCLAFLAHEPLLVMLGLRGPKMQQRDGARATRRLAVLATGTAVAGAAGLALAPPATWLVAALLLAPVGAVIALAWRRSEHTLIGELLAAIALSGAGAPVLVASGAALAIAVRLWLDWALGFAASVVAVHRVIARHKRPASSIDLAAALGLVAVDAACLAIAARAATTLIAAPLLSLAALLVIAPPAASRLRAIGVAIAVASAVSAALALTISAG